MHDLKKEIEFATLEEARQHTAGFESILPLCGKISGLTPEEALGSQYCTISFRDENGNETEIESTLEKIRKYNKLKGTKIWEETP